MSVPKLVDGVLLTDRYCGIF